MCIYIYVGVCVHAHMRVCVNKVISSWIFLHKEILLLKNNNLCRSKSSFHYLRVYMPMQQQPA
jgi:hypothetical protein